MLYFVCLASFLSLNTDLHRPEIFEIVSPKVIVTAEARLDGLVGVDTKNEGMRETNRVYPQY